MHVPASHPTLDLAHEGDLRTFVCEYIRNRLAVSSTTTVAVPGVEVCPWVHSWWNEAVRPPGHLCVQGMGCHTETDLALVGAGLDVPLRCREALFLPDAAVAEVHVLWSALRLRIKDGGPTVLIVPGTASGPDHELTPGAVSRLKWAEQLAESPDIRAVILSGWGRRHGNLPEAEQLRHLWQGPPVPLITDVAARTTAENALCAEALLRGIPDVRRVVLVSSWGNALRQHLLAWMAFRGTGRQVRSRVAWGRQHGSTWWPGLSGLPRMRHHLRAGRRMLMYGSEDEQAIP